MTIVDWIIIGIAGIGLIIGLCKGFLNQVVSLVGFAAVVVGTVYLFQYPYKWFEALIANEQIRKIVAIAATFLTLAVACGVIGSAVLKAFKNVKFLKGIDVLLGGALSLALVYSIVAILVAMMTRTSEEFLPQVKNFLQPHFQNSWIVANIYKENFVGNWVFDVISTKIAL